MRLPVMDGRGNERRTIRVEIVLVTALGPVQSPAKVTNAPTNESCCGVTVH